MCLCVCMYSYVRMHVFIYTSDVGMYIAAAYTDTAAYTRSSHILLQQREVHGE
jgi:hypothetical protein